MAEEPRRKSHAMAWTLGVVAALLLYLLCAPWLDYVSARFGDRYPTFHSVCVFCRAPNEWISENTPLRTPLAVYSQWVWSLIDETSAPEARVCSSLLYFDKDKPPYQEDFIWDRDTQSWLLFAIQYDSDSDADNDWRLDRSLVIFQNQMEEHDHSPADRIPVSKEDDVKDHRDKFLDVEGQFKLFERPAPEHQANEGIRKRQDWQDILKRIGASH